MSATGGVERAFRALREAIEKHLVEVLDHLQPPEAFDRAVFEGRTGFEQLGELWALTGGQAEETILGVFGGAQLLGPGACAHERAKWADLLDASGIANPSWDSSTSLDPHAVRGVYFAAGWFPLLREPLEGNYLAVDLDPLPGGTPGQIIVCGRDEDEKCVVAPDVVSLLERLGDECEQGLWSFEDTEDGPFVEREGGRLFGQAKRWLPHAED